MWDIANFFFCSLKISKHFKEKGATTPPSRLKFGRENPDVWILPEKSVVLQVKAAEVIPSDSMDAKFSLRY